MSGLSETREKIGAIIKELHELEEDQLALGVRIHLLAEELESLQITAAARPTRTKERKVSLIECRTLIGHRVRIINPRRGEPTVGTITKVQALYVTVKLEGGTLRRRIPSNLRLIEDE